MTVTSGATSTGESQDGPSLELVGLRRRFGPVIALDGLTFGVPRVAAVIYGRSILRTGSRVRLREVLGSQPAS